MTKQKYQHKRRHWRGWPKVLAWIFLFTSGAISISEASTSVNSQYLRMGISTMLTIIGFLIRHWVYQNARTISVLYALRRDDQKALTAIERRLDIHIAECKYKFREGL